MAIEVQDIRAEIAKHDGARTKVYIGCDSVRKNISGVWHATYMVAVVVHINGCNGCKLFGEMSQQRDYDKKESPNTRLLNEAYKVVEVFMKLKEVLDAHYCEVHLDLNPDTRWASSKVINQAKGYVKGMTGHNPIVKPHAFAAQYAADRLVNELGYMVIN